MNLIPIIDNDGVQSVDARELHTFLNVGRDFTSWMKQRIERYGFTEGEDYILTLTKTGERRNISMSSYVISLDMAKELSMVENNVQGRRARKYFIEVEKEYRLNTKELSKPEQILNVITMLQNEVLQLETTKAEIGNRREATAMNTASQAVKRANKLERELDQSTQYATVKRMQMAYHGQKFKWQELRSVSKEMQLQPIDVFDANYGTVKAYHADAWLEAYAVTINN